MVTQTLTKVPAQEHRFLLEYTWAPSEYTWAPSTSLVTLMYFVYCAKLLLKPIEVFLDTWNISALFNNLKNNAEYIIHVKVPFFPTFHPSRRE